MKKEHMRAFERWLDANYGDAHPSWIFMRNAWQAGVLYALTYSACQQDVQADAETCCDRFDALTKSAFCYCGHCGRKLRTA